MLRQGKSYIKKLISNMASGKVSIKIPSFRVSIGFGAGVACVFAVALALTYVFFGTALHSSNQFEDKFSKDAGAVCTQLVSEYGICKTQYMGEDSKYMLTGLSYIREMDFNGDGDAELLAVYNNNGVYYTEIWGYDGGEFQKLYSGKANSVAGDSSLGSWVTIYHDSGRYYIGELSTEDNTSMNLLTLSFSEFKVKKECSFDTVTETYTIDGEVNTLDFETIKLSYISENKAGLIAESVDNNIENFNTGEAVAVSAQKTDEQLMYSAYYSIIEKYNTKYGVAKYDSSSKICFADGLCTVKLIDFNGDGKDELLTVYRYNKKVSSEDKKGNYLLITEPAYKLEIYWWNGSKAQRVLENDGVSTMQEKDGADQFYILQKDGEKYNYCRNSYVYNENTSRVWKGTSRISVMDENGVFTPDLNAVVNNNYGYYSYYLDGKKTYKSKFKTTGYQVPYFCNEDDYDTSEFTLCYVQGTSDKGSDIMNGISQTEDTIEKIKAGR